MEPLQRRLTCLSDGKEAPSDGNAQVCILNKTLRTTLEIKRWINTVGGQMDGFILLHQCARRNLVWSMGAGCNAVGHFLYMYTCTHIYIILCERTVVSGLFLFEHKD